MRVLPVWPLSLGLILVPLSVSTMSAKELPAPAARSVSYEDDVEPILRRACYSCHGADKQEGGLRLDLRDRAIQGGDSGASFVAGASATSRLVLRVAGLAGDEERMPPEGTPLSDDEVGVLRAWIDQGITWPDRFAGGVSRADLWVLRPWSDGKHPTPHQAGWAQGELDTYILDRLEREQIAPASEADRTTLARRVHLDLLGLPPSPEETRELLADDRPDWYERLVERLLASPHFGERWGRHWLDLARYADSDGYEKDRPRPHAWRYRQWVLESLNADMPFNEFSVTQLAGDLVSGATLDHRVASGFHRNTLHNTEGGADQEEDRVKKTVDRTNTLGTIWLGLTVGCAQCHSHKYDPLTQREYYQLYAFFNSLDEQDIDAPLPVDAARYQLAKAAFDQEHAPFVAALQNYEQTRQPAAQAEWERTALQNAVLWHPLDVQTSASKHGADLQVQPDRSVLPQGKNIDSDLYTIEAVSPVTSLQAIRLEVLPDDRLPSKGPGRADHGNFVLTQFTLETVDRDGRATRLALTKPQADFSQQDCDVSFAINDQPDDFWAIAPQMGKRHVAVFSLTSPVELPAGVRLRISLDQQYGRANQPPHNLGKFRLSVTDSPSPPTLEGWPAAVVAALRKSGVEQRSPEEAKLVAEHFRSLDPEWGRLRQQVEEHAKRAPAAPDTKAQIVMQRSEPRPTRILVRGDFLNPGDQVEPATPAWLPPLVPRSGKPDRVDLANWLVSSQNPLTPRVTVNRVWERVFGRGIVATSDDFGRQGERPSHAELLDWLARDFVDHGWSLKHLLRRIVTSSVYRQSSALRSELNAIDPENVLLARQSRRRVEAEVIRDLALAASGLLDPRVGGPSVRPPQPAEYADLTYANSVKWVTSSGGDRYRRGIYTFFQRTSPYPMLMTFDSPDSNECCARRDSSNTPLQALTLWNDPAFFECSQAIGRRIVREVPTAENADSLDAARADQGFLLCLGRPASATERQEVVELFRAQVKLAAAQPDRVQALLGAEAGSAGARPDELAAWTLVGRTLMNLDEFVTRE